MLSDSRFAARPVGAASATLTPLTLRIFRIELTSVVLPTPGPPVMTRTFDRSASRTASRWLSARVMPALLSTHGMALSASIAGQGREPDASVRRRAAMARSARCSPARKMQGSLVDGVGDDLAVLQLQLERGLDDRGWHLQQLGGHRQQLLMRQPAVALVHRFGQRVADAGAGADHRRLLDAELLGDQIGALEADAADVAREPIRVLGDHAGWRRRRRS